jgi:predicted nucleic acid-binding Zn ribbon protein
MCVVRNDGGDDPIGACERCEVNGRSFGHRFCSYCCGTILLENRQRELAQ